MAKVLITGTSGYLGSCLYNEMISGKTKEVQSLEGRLNEIKAGSLDFDLVIHCAGALRYRKDEHYSSNNEGTKFLIEGLKKETPIVYISSKSIYGTQRNGILDESSMPMPDDDYGNSKYLGEQLVIKSGLPYLILRSSTLFGLGFKNLGPAFPSVGTKMLFLGKDISLNSPDIIHDYLYIKDFCSIIVRLSETTNTWNNTFNVAGPHQSLYEMIKEIDKIAMPSKGKIQFSNKPSNPGFLLDSTKLINVLGPNIYTKNEVIFNRIVEYLKSIS